MPRKSTAEQLKEIAKQMGTKNLFVTFTTVDKVGINPGSTYSTPLGIYCYPLAYVIGRIKNDVINVPFAGKAPFLSVLQSNGNLVDLADEELCLRLAKRMLDTREHPEDVLPDAYKRYPDPVTFWSASLYVANGRSENPETSVQIARKWNRVFRDAGIDGVVDSEGKGIIHGNEPTQAVFFHTGAFKVIARIANGQRSGSSSKVAGGDREYDRAHAFTLIRSTDAFKRFKDTIAGAVMSKLEEVAERMDVDRDVTHFKVDDSLDNTLIERAVGDLLSDPQVVKICKQNSVDIRTMERPLRMINMGPAIIRMSAMIEDTRVRHFHKWDRLLDQAERSKGSIKELQAKWGWLKSVQRALQVASKDFGKQFADSIGEALNSAVEFARTDI